MHATRPKLCSVSAAPAWGPRQEFALCACFSPAIITASTGFGVWCSRLRVQSHCSFFIVPRGDVKHNHFRVNVNLVDKRKCKYAAYQAWGYVEERCKAVCQKSLQTIEEYRPANGSCASSSSFTHSSTTLTPSPHSLQTTANIRENPGIRFTLCSAGALCG
jgi:hypothetical protein